MVFTDPLHWFAYQLRLVKVGAKRGNPMFVGIGSTKLFLLTVGILALGPQYSSGEWSWRLLSFFTSPANEIGDTLAGIAGTLAFLWIIVTVMMQSKELAAQREELRLTRTEFKRMASAQEQQAQINRETNEASAKILRTQLLDQEFDELLQSIRQNFYSLDLSWDFDRSDNDFLKQPFNVKIEVQRDDTSHNSDFFPRLQHELWTLLFDLNREMKMAKLMTSPIKIVDFPSLIFPQFRRLNEMYKDLSPAKKTKLKYLGIDSIFQSLVDLDDDKWWLSP